MLHSNESLSAAMQVGAFLVGFLEIHPMFARVDDIAALAVHVEQRFLNLDILQQLTLRSKLELTLHTHHIQVHLLPLLQIDNITADIDHGEKGVARSLHIHILHLVIQKHELFIVFIGGVQLCHHIPSNRINLFLITAVSCHHILPDLLHCLHIFGICIHVIIDIVMVLFLFNLLLFLRFIVIKIRLQTQTMQQRVAAMMMRQQAFLVHIAGVLRMAAAITAAFCDALSQHFLVHCVIHLRHKLLHLRMAIQPSHYLHGTLQLLCIQQLQGQVAKEFKVLKTAECVVQVCVSLDIGPHCAQFFRRRLKLLQQLHHAHKQLFVVHLHSVVLHNLSVNAKTEIQCYRCFLIHTERQTR
mmetsp:Transcript_7493/g.11663  ORF Transcript_7493/g.11663 Transcript_7493/m.11663 type:complete len:356 (+) Transcript_7493:612-1679(+)